MNEPAGLTFFGLDISHTFLSKQQRGVSIFLSRSTGVLFLSHSHWEERICVQVSFIVFFLFHTGSVGIKDNMISMSYSYIILSILSPMV